jgi:hypothetical protein
MATIVSLLPSVAHMARGVPSRILVDAYRRAVREFCARTRWSTRTLAAFPTVIDQVSYTLALDGGDDQVEVIGVRWLRINTGGELKRMTETFVDQEDLNVTSGESDGYEYRPHGVVLLDPPPSGVWNLTAKVVVQPTRVATEIDDNLLVDWEEGLIAGALYHLYRMPNTAWFNVQAGNDQHGLFNNAIHSAKSDVARNYNAGAELSDTIGRQNASIRQKHLPI